MLPLEKCGCWCSVFEAARGEDGNKRGERDTLSVEMFRAAMRMERGQVVKRRQRRVKEEWRM